LFLWIEKKSQAQAREANMERTQLSKGRDKIEDNNIPNARDKARKRKGNRINL